MYRKKDIPKKYLQNWFSTPLGNISSLCEVFNENTKLHHGNSRAYSKKIVELKDHPTLVKTMSMPKKTYSVQTQIPLEAITTETGLEDAIEKRRSIRTFSSQALSRQELSKLLHYSYGIMDPQSRYRAVPSAGALYPAELYFAAINIEGLEQGIYHYDPNGHSLSELSSGLELDKMKELIFMDDADLSTANLIFFLSGVFARSTIKYQDRGYRMLLMEIGAIAQNFFLIATQLGMAGCAYGGFLDDMVNEILGLDGVNESVLLPILAGKI